MCLKLILLGEITYKRRIHGGGMTPQNKNDTFIGNTLILVLQGLNFIE